MIYNIKDFKFERYVFYVYSNIRIRFHRSNNTNKGTAQRKDVSFNAGSLNASYDR